MSELQWGGRVQGAGVRVFNGTAFGVLTGSVPEGAERAASAAVLEVLVELLAGAPSPAALAADRRALSAELTRAARAPMAEKGVSGEITVLGGKIEEKARPVEATPELTVEQYASLCVERTLQPGADLAVAQRYQVLTLRALQAVDAQWGQRLAADGTLQQRWQQACAHYQSWLRQRG